MEPIPDPELTAIYARKSMKGDKREITVNRQKRLALDDCEKLGLTVHQENIFVDNGASAWKRNRKRPGWDALIAKARRGEIRHIVMYHEDRGLRQPRDLEELLNIAEEHEIRLYGRANARNLRDHNDRYNLRIEVAHACRSSDDTSRRMKDQKQERAENGLPMGARAYGYTKNGMKIIQREAEIIREIFDRYGKGETPWRIADDLSKRGIPAAKGGAWTETAVRRQLRNTRVAGIAVLHGQEIGAGKWPAIITRAQWEFTQELLAFRSSAARSEQAKRKAPRTYILRGLATCGKCGTVMPGTNGKYRCARSKRNDAMKCNRTMKAEPLEKFVEDAAVRLLENLTISGRPARTVALEAAERAIEDDERQLAELHDMWISKEIETAEYRKDRRTIQARINQNQKKTVARVKSPDAIADLIGPGAKAKWARLTDERKNSVLRFLFSAVIIGEGTMSRYPSTIDFGRIEIEQNEIA
jgi:site-specific DNA recombinase